MAISNLDLPSSSNVATVRKLNTPPVSSLVRIENGVAVKTECYKFIKAMIVMLNQYFGVTWSDFQMIEIAQELYSEYYFWTIADWKLFGKKCKRMEYADPEKGMMGFFSPDKLMSWSARYNQEWILCSQSFSESTHNILTREEKLCTTEDRLKSEDDARKVHNIAVQQFRVQHSNDQE